jgi:hypothetical protein
MPKKAKINRQSVFEIVGGSPMKPELTQQAPPLTAGFAPQVDIITSIVSALNGNPYMVALAYLFLNLSGRFLTMELTKQQESFLADKAIRPIILFCVMFVATRNLAAAFWSTLAFLSVIWVFANENHIMCLVPHWRKKDEEKDKNYDENIKIIQNTEKKEDKPVA